MGLIKCRTRARNELSMRKPEYFRSGLGAPVLALTAVGGLYYLYKRGQGMSFY